ncbi:hypothetical protein ACFOLF_33000 [Paenibacillus sepulcri]|uniref:Gram-positive cocci surface proteins LPxTG domain-containing protein n=1 Tax=Paenibacillus sepulcri TaxID=359917 RepID=A0ABS7CF56_9BACL|nr:hypothetical protein [Paenibacillus sepulcri]
MFKKCVVIVLGLVIMLSAAITARPEAVFACSCAFSPADQQVEDELERKSAIFAGKVTKVTPPKQKRMMSSADLVEIVFEVTKAWKGKVGSRTAVYTAMSSASCGYEGFQVGSEYLISGYEKSGHLETTICDMTLPLSSATKQLAVLGTGYPPSPVSAPESAILGQEGDQTEIPGNLSSTLIILTAAVILIGGTLLILLRKRRR